MGQIGEYNAGIILAQIHFVVNDVENDGTHIEGWRRVHIYRSGQGHLEGLRGIGTAIMEAKLEQ